MQVIIPMSGSGQRFKDAGYTTIKPLITVHGKTFVEYVISLFSANDQFIFICDAEHLEQANLRKVLTTAAPQGIIIPIAKHKKGPVYAVQQAFSYIDDAQPCIVNYCDFFMEWNYQQFVNSVIDSSCDGAIPCYTGFHPHLLHAHNVYAGCKVDAANRLVSIKEKYSFEADKTKGHHSVGTYYFKNGALLKYYIDDLIKREHHLNGEYYASMLYEQMLIDNKFIQVYDEIKHFCQWGTPEDFEEYLIWQDIFLEQKNYSVAQNSLQLKNTTLLLPMAGEGKRFADEGFTLPKPFIPVDGVPMYQRAIADLPTCGNQIFITKLPLPDVSGMVMQIEQTTQGQAATCLLAKEHIALNDPLIIAPCDNGMVYDVQAFLKLQATADVIIFTFRNNPAVNNFPNQYGWVEISKDKAVHISCKKAISTTPKNDHAITGAFWFKKGSYFIEAAEKMINDNRRINHEFYVDECMNDCIAAGLNVYYFEIEHYICWGTPNDYKTYLYWKDFFKDFV